MDNDGPNHQSGDENAAPSADAPGRLAELGYGTEAIALLGIGRLHGVGFQTLCRLGGRDGIRRLLETKDVAAFDRSIAEAGGRFSAAASLGDWPALRRRIWTHGTDLAASLAEAEVGFQFDGDPRFPRAFVDLPLPSRPQWLYYKGDLAVLDRPCIAVVGTRDPTPDGDFLARYAVSCARELGAPVVSGLARGIDRVVHEWCLRVGLPTVSVMGTGILNPYPARHAGLGEEIAKSGGLLVSEYVPEQGPSAENFVWRNRLQAALGYRIEPRHARLVVNAALAFTVFLIEAWDTADERKAVTK